MEIKKAYSTSKGLFWSKEEAGLKKNCAKISDGMGWTYGMIREEIKEVYVLTDGTNAFQLTPVEVQ